MVIYIIQIKLNCDCLGEKLLMKEILLEDNKKSNKIKYNLKFVS